MATPTPGKHAQVAATPPVSTPFSNRPVPSPAKQFKQSPANSNTLYGHNFPVGYDSPSAAMALGMDGLGGGMGMNMGMVMGSLGAPVGEDEKKRRLATVLEILKTSKGRLSEASTERLARRLGLECLWEDSPSSSGGTRTLIIAGTAMALDIEFANNIVKKVSLSFPEASEIVTKHKDKAENILLRDLEFQSGESSLTKLLDRFAANLERLAQLDKLSVIPGLNCHEAIAGIYESLEKLHGWETTRLAEHNDMAGKTREYIERAATCTKSGRPIMHAGDRMGLSLDYWEEKRRIQTKAIKDEEQKIWSLTIECAPMLELVYTPIRVSDKWISPDIKKDNPNPEDFLSMVGTNDLVLDWLEPEATFLPSADPSSSKFTEVMFVAKFNPPLVVPYNLAMTLHNSTNSSIEPYEMSFFDELLFPKKPDEKQEVGESRKIKNPIVVHVFSKNGDSFTKISSNILHIEKKDYGRTMAFIPFSHPRHLVEMLPHLRQYAFLSTILRKSFTPDSKLPTIEASKSLATNKKERFAEFLAQNTTVKKKHDLSVTLTTQPVPTLQLAFQLKEKPANVTFQIGVNGVVEVLSQDILGDSSQMKAADLGRMLEITEDLGVWMEFVTQKIG